MHNFMQSRVSFGQKIGLFFCFWLLTTIIGSFVVGFIMLKWGSDSTPALRIATVLQDIIMFVTPCIATAMLVTRTPATLLCLDHIAKPRHFGYTLLVLVLSIPAMNWLIEWNSAIQFPESMHGVEEWIRLREESASAMITVMLGKPHVADLIMSVLIVGVLTGLSEELFFRGALQRILQSRPMNAHFAIWTTAVVFSAMHMQFYGFVLRLLLGAFFGYLLWWGGSLWLPIVAHAFNNIVTVVFTWLLNRGVLESDPNQLGATSTTGDTIIAITSVIATVIAIVCLRRSLLNTNQTSCGGTQNCARDTSL